MAKDPAFLFYSNDFDAATKFFTHEQVGRYLRLMIAQHQHGHLSEKQMIFICGSHDEEVFLKFKRDEKGQFFNERLDLEIDRRKRFSESRSKNRTKADSYERDMNNISKTSDNHMDQHMETETEIETIIETKTESETQKTKKVKQKSISIDTDPLENPFSEQFFWSQWQSWKKYRQEILKKPVLAGASENAALKMLWKDSEGNEQVAGEIIERSLAGRWQGLFQLDRKTGSNGHLNGSRPMTANQKLDQMVNHNANLSPPPDKFVEVIDASGQRFTGNLELDPSGLMVFIKAGRTRLTIDPQNNYHASCVYKLAPGRTIQEVREHLINEKMEFV